VQSPHAHTTLASLHHTTHPLRGRAQLVLTKYPSYVSRRFSSTDIKKNETISTVAEPGRGVVGITREECWSSQSVQQRDDVLILYPRPPRLVDNPAKVYSPLGEK
jgi:hypothetical protein